MKKGLHPTYYQDVKVVCACGNEFATGSTLKELHVEVCSACHPFFTGKQKLVDTAGRVDRYKKRVEKTSKSVKKHTSKREKLEKKQQKKVEKAEQ